MRFSDEVVRKETVGVMKEIAKARYPELKRGLENLLTPEEREVQQYVDGLAFQEGNWYRPPHNIVVPASMVAICCYEGFSRDLVFVAQMHDAGNSQIKIEETTKGADWERVDKRWAHMQIGSDMLQKELEDLRQQGVMEISDERIGKLRAIVATHDFPYLGMPLTDDEARAHRGADRTFVPSALSFWKDLMAYHATPKYLEGARNMGFELNSEAFLKARFAFFYENRTPLSHFPGKLASIYALDKRLAAWNEGGRCEPPYTKVEKEIIDFMLAQRAEEVGIVSDEGVQTPAQFGALFERAFVDETSRLLAYAGGDKKAFRNSSRAV